MDVADDLGEGFWSMDDGCTKRGGASGNVFDKMVRTKVLHVFLF